MKAAVGAVIFVAVLSGTALPSTSPVSRMHWLAGCWSTGDHENGSVEHWMAPAGGSMLGMSRTVRAGRTVSFEFLRITENDERGTVLIAMPSGQQLTVFPLRSQSDTEAVFENAEHDFPQRVIYRLDGMKLLGRIEGTVDGSMRHVDFPMTRADCEAGSGPAPAAARKPVS